MLGGVSIVELIQLFSANTAISRVHIKPRPVIMGDIIMSDDVLANHTGFMVDPGPYLMAQAPDLRNDEIITVTSGPQPDVWETHRLTIKRLYLDEDKPLKEVMDIMQRDYGHRGTAKMYKSRITKWRLDKNCKAKEMKAIAWKKVVRDAIGKPSSFRIRGRNTDVEEVRRYFRRRNGLSLEEVVARDKSPVADTPSAVEYSTPGASASPRVNHSIHVPSAGSMIVAADEDPHDQISRPQRENTDHRTSRALRSFDLDKNRLNRMNEDLRRLASANDVSPSLVPPRDLLVPEWIFSTIKAYVKGSLEEGIWKINRYGYLEPRKGPRSGEYAVNYMYQCCLAAVHMLRRNLFVEARQLLSRACEKSKNFLEEGHVRTIPIIFFIYFRLKDMGYSAFAIKVLEHLRTAAALTHSISCTLRCLLDNLLTLDQNVNDVYSIAWGCWEDTIENHIEPLNRTWLSSRLDHIYTTGSITGWQEVERLLRSLAIKCEYTYGKLNTRYWLILQNLAWILYYQYKHEEAEQLSLYVIQEIENTEDACIPLWWIMHSLDVMSVAQYSQSKHDLAQNSLERCMDMAAQCYEKDHPMTMKYLLRLEGWLQNWGRQGEAEELAAQRSQILGSPIIEELID